MKAKDLRLLLCLSVCVVAPSGWAQEWLWEKPLQNELDLSREQREQAAELRFEFDKGEILRRAEMEVKEMELRALLDEPKPDIEQVDGLIDEIGDLRTEQMREDIHTSLQARKILDEEQTERWQEIKERKPQAEKPFAPPLEERHEQRVREIQERLTSLLNEKVEVLREEAWQQMERTREEIRSWLARMREEIDRNVPNDPAPEEQE